MHKRTFCDPVIRQFDKILIRYISSVPVDRMLLSLVFFLFLLCAYFSLGYYHYDEHYQIIEFALWKLGVNNNSNLPWEFHEQIRPTLQPWIAFSIFRVFDYFGLSDAYTLAFLLRLTSAMFSICSIFYLIKATLYYIEEGNKLIFKLLSFFLWFIPFLSVRFSSETWSGNFFVLGVSFFLLFKQNDQYKHFLVSGLLLGLSFFCRFQSGFLIGGFFLWALFCYKAHPRNLFAFCGGLLIAISIGIILDCLFYEQIVITPWNYFKANIVNDVASQFGVRPWFYYLWWLTKAPTLFIGIALCILFLFLLFRKPKHFLVWSILPFFIIHSLIPHKEGRFLFPLANLCPLLIVLGYQEIVKVAKGYINRFREILLSIYFLFFAMINIIALIVVILSPAGTGSKEITRYLHLNLEKERTQLYFHHNSNPYSPLYKLGLDEKFYSENNVVQMDLSQMLAENSKKDYKNSYIVIRKGSLDNDSFVKIKNKFSLEEVKQSIPRWAEFLNEYYNPEYNRNILVLYKVKY